MAIWLMNMYTDYCSEYIATQKHQVTVNQTIGAPKHIMFKLKIHNKHVYVYMELLISEHT